jgi:hypothetical protein
MATDNTSLGSNEGVRLSETQIRNDEMCVTVLPLLM